MTVPNTSDADVEEIHIISKLIIGYNRSLPSAMEFSDYRVRIVKRLMFTNHNVCTPPAVFRGVAQESGSDVHQHKQALKDLEAKLVVRNERTAGGMKLVLLRRHPHVSLSCCRPSQS